MGRPLPHTKLINEAAREVLAPLGLRRVGRSRLWVDDQRWWIGVVEFQPSSWARGSYLNVGVGWLWGELGDTPPEDAESTVSWSFGFDRLGSRVELPGGTQFAEFASDEQFAPVAEAIARTAGERVEEQRARLRTPADAAAALLAGWDISSGRDTAVALALAGRTAEALAALDAASEPVRTRIGTGDEIAGDTEMLERDLLARERVASGTLSDIARQAVRGHRRRLGLPELDTPPF